MNVNPEARDHEAAGALADELPWWGWLDDNRTCLTRAGELVSLAELSPSVLDGQTPQQLDRVVDRWQRMLSSLDSRTRLYFYLLRRAGRFDRRRPRRQRRGGGGAAQAPCVSVRTGAGDQLLPRLVSRSGAGNGGLAREPGGRGGLPMPGTGWRGSGTRTNPSTSTRTSRKRRRASGSWSRPAGRWSMI